MEMASLYRRSLPSPPAVDFSSAEGKLIFIEALQKGTMEGFFKLISCFQTQSKTTYCGLASLSVVLNALSIDPGRKWRGPWRWFDESMLDCFDPVNIEKDKGTSFGEIFCLAHFAGAKVEAFRTNQSTIDDFRESLVKCSTSEHCHVISTYDRAVLKQTGQGHFSPIGGFNAERDMALILDVARFKYPPHWVPLKLLWEAMDSIDPSTGKHRGFMLISRPHREPGLLYTLSCRDESWISITNYLKEDVPRLVSLENVDSVERILSVVFKSFPSNFNQFIKWVGEIPTTEDADENLSKEEISRLNLKHTVLREVHETKLFKHISKLSSSMGYEDSLTYSAVKACCQGAGIFCKRTSKEFRCRKTSVKCVKGSGGTKGAMVSRVMLAHGSEQMVDLLVPSTKTECNRGPETNYPAGNDVFTVLLLALPPQTWSGIKDQAVMHEIKQLMSTTTLPTLLQEEVSHLGRQLELLIRCQENKEEEDLTASSN